MEVWLSHGDVCGRISGFALVMGATMDKLLIEYIKTSVTGFLKVGDQVLLVLSPSLTWPSLPRFKVGLLSE